MQVIKKKDQKIIKSYSCGKLLEVINKSDFPFGIMLSEEIKTSEAHYQKVSRKCYWMLEGWVDLIIENVKTHEKHTFRLEEGDVVTIEPFERHQIIDGSVKNKLVTIISPAWHIEDVVKD